MSKMIYYFVDPLILRNFSHCRRIQPPKKVLLSKQFHGSISKYPSPTRPVFSHYQQSLERDRDVSDLKMPPNRDRSQSEPLPMVSDFCWGPWKKGCEKDWNGLKMLNIRKRDFFKRAPGKGFRCEWGEWCGPNPLFQRPKNNRVV